MTTPEPFQLEQEEEESSHQEEEEKEVSPSESSTTREFFPPRRLSPVRKKNKKKRKKMRKVKKHVVNEEKRVKNMKKRAEQIASLEIVPIEKKNSARTPMHRRMTASGKDLLEFRAERLRKKASKQKLLDEEEEKSSSARYDRLYDCYGLVEVKGGMLDAEYRSFFKNPGIGKWVEYKSDLVNVMEPDTPKKKATKFGESIKVMKSTKQIEEELQKKTEEASRRMKIDHKSVCLILYKRRDVPET